MVVELRNSPYEPKDETNGIYQLRGNPSQTNEIREITYHKLHVLLLNLSYQVSLLLRFSIVYHFIEKLLQFTLRFQKN